jgi:hypothetical protein
MITVQAHSEDRQATIWISGEGRKQTVRLPSDHPAVVGFEAAVRRLATGDFEAIELSGLGHPQGIPARDRTPTSPGA